MHIKRHSLAYYVILNDKEISKHRKNLKKKCVNFFISNCQAL